MTGDRRPESQDQGRAWALGASHACAALAACLLASGCLDGTAPQQSASTGALGSSGGGGSTFGGSAGTTVAAYQAAYNVKVIFNKQSFYNNNYPNSLGCAGDARYYYNPFSDRRVPTKPNWLKNIAVELTNSNAPFGASRAVTCGLSGLGAAPAANCAAFDDLQPLDGSVSRGILVGGYGCASGAAGCATNNVIGDIWTVNIADVNTVPVWSQQNGVVPPYASGDANGLVWAGGDYDQLHDQFYLYGGASPNTTSANGTETITGNVVKFSMGSDGNIATATPPAVMAPFNVHTYVGWASGTYDADAKFQQMFPPPALAGATFTYGLRRDPTMKSACKVGDTIPSFSTFNPPPNSNLCASGFWPATSAIAANEHDDYFLLVGGLDPAASPVAGYMSNAIYAFKPHGISNDVLGASTPIAVNGDWNLLSNSPTSGTKMSKSAMSIVDIAPNGANTALPPYLPTFVGGTRPVSGSQGGDIFSGWTGRAFHRTVYDPTMNRFYIFGGITPHNPYTGTPPDLGSSPVVGVANNAPPDLATNDVWIYDPPALGRRPTAACFTALTPDNQPLPTPAPMGAQFNLGVNRAYGTGRFAFPPGGCLERVLLPTAPASRFEHSMAFDRDDKAMVVFGGCNTTKLIPGNNSAQAGDPTLGCTLPTSVLSDLWVYLPPVVTEIVPNTYTSDTSTSAATPYKSTTLLPNVFGTDFWLDHLSLFPGDDPANGTQTQPTTDQVLGTWIQLSPQGATPPARFSASMAYDRAHHVFYLQGGYGCANSLCSTGLQPLNDTWIYTPPNFATDCSRVTGTCVNQGSWTNPITNLPTSNATPPTIRKGAVLAYSEPMFSHGDDFYTITDNQCFLQGPIATNDPSTNKQYVGAIYVDVDRSQLGGAENLLINLRMLPFDQNTKLPAWYNTVPGNSFDVTDTAGTSDQAVIRVQLLSDPLGQSAQIQASIQPRYHEFLTGTPVLGNTFMYVSGASGQVTEKQIFVPLSIDPTINLVKIERVQGSIKFYEMTVSRF